MTNARCSSSAAGHRAGVVRSRLDRGFSMLEVLITILIVSFAMLGMAGLFANGLRLNNSSYLRSLATQQAYDLADRMRANIAGMLSGGYDSIAAVTSTATCTDCKDSSCAPDVIATYDACVWNNDNVTLLPKGSGTVSRDGNVFTITVSWDDTRSGSADTDFVVRLEP